MHKKSDKSQAKLHIGKMIQAEVKRTGRKVTWLAERLGCHRNNIYLIYTRSWIDTETLMKISVILEHDFFNDLSEIYRSLIPEKKIMQ